MINWPNLGVHLKWDSQNENGMEMDWYENTWKWMKMSGNEKTELKLLKKCTLSDNWNTYDPFGEVFFFAAGPFLKHSVFLAPAFAFGCGSFLAQAFAFGCGLLREPDWLIRFYYTVITLTTVGFGDLSPTEDWEKVISLQQRLTPNPTPFLV